VLIFGKGVSLESNEVSPQRNRIGEKARIIDPICPSPSHPRVPASPYPRVSPSPSLSDGGFYIYRTTIFGYSSHFSSLVLEPHLLLLLGLIFSICNGYLRKIYRLFVKVGNREQGTGKRFSVKMYRKSFCL